MPSLCFFICGCDPQRRIREIRRKAVMVFQKFNLFPHITVLGNIIEGAVTVKGVPKKQAIAQAEKFLDWMQLLAKRDEFPVRLAAGQQQPVAIARSLCLEPKIMLFDDPTSALDPVSSSEIMAMMARLANEGIAKVVVTHELYLARQVADRVILMDDGRWVEMASPDELFTNPQKERTHQFLAHFLSLAIG